MAEIKEETLANLYALRAGMSMMSAILDKVWEASNRCQYISEKMIPSLNGEIGKTATDAQEEREHYISEIETKKEKEKGYREQLKNLKKEKTELIENKKRAAKKVIKILGLVIFLFSFFIFSVILTVITPLGSKLSFQIFFILTISGWLSMFVLIGFIVYLIITIKKLSQIKKQARAKLPQIETLIKTREKLLEEVLAQIKEREDCQAWKFNQIEANRSKTKTELTRKMKAAESERLDCEAVILAEKNKFSAVYESVQKQFSSFLDERDWANVDLIIFNYETGRAVDLRDALLQVDMERRNEKLVAALKYATQEICESIRRGFGNMQTLLDRKLTSLNDTVKVSMAKVQNSIKQIIQQNKGIQKSLGSLTAISSAQQALQEKSVFSSDAMAEDIHFMKEEVRRNYRY